MCSIDTHEKQQTSYVDDGSSGGGNALKSNATTVSLILLSVKFDLIACWIKFLDSNYTQHSNM